MYTANDKRYEKMPYVYCGKSGLMLPEISLGLWHNFGSVDFYENAAEMARCAFDLGITHFDLATNYGPVPGSAEETFGKILKTDFAPYRDELIISTKAGYYMHPGPYGDGGSRKYLVSSLDKSLKRLGLDYVDIFYSHRMDPNTPLEETAEALAGIYRSGKALYIGISNYSDERTRKIYEILASKGVKLLIHQARYSMLCRTPEEELFGAIRDCNIGCIVFSPLAQGLLSDKYLNGIPENSRAAKPTGYLKAEAVTPDLLEILGKLNDIAQNRGQSLAQMALAWVLRRDEVTSALIGASSPEQIRENVAALNNKDFSQDELLMIDKILKGNEQ